MQSPEIPQSVPDHLIKMDPALWQVRAVDWLKLDNSQHIVVGSSFVDPKDPNGPLGNPFSVVIGNTVDALEPSERLAIAKQTNTPETVFINSCLQRAGEYAVNLTVYTPSGAEMGACAHGFLGALQTLIQTGRVAKQTKVAITTTVDTSALALVDAEGGLALEFEAAPSRQLSIDGQQLTNIYGVSFGDFKNRGVLSVGSPKLIVEVTPEVFDSIQRNLRNINYEALLQLQDDQKINGIHLFCRNPQTRFPEKCIQNNAYSGPENLADRATGVSNAAQIIADEHVKQGQSLQVTQFSFDGPSAILALKKLEGGKAMVGGAATLFNVQ